MLPDLKNDFPSYPVDNVYLDSATHGLQPKCTIESQYNFTMSINNTIRKGIHKLSRKSTEKYLESKNTIAEFIGSTVENLAWIPNVDYGWNVLLQSLIKKYGKLNVISTVFEHHSFLSPLVYWNNQGSIDLELLSLNEEVCIAEKLDTDLGQNTIIVLGHTTPVLGLYRDIKEITKKCKEHDVISVIDFSRTAGQTDINLANNKTDISFFESSGDLLGPQATGIVNIKDHLIEELDNIFLSSSNVSSVSKDKVDEISGIEKFEVGNPNISGLVGMASSIKYLDDLGISNIEKHREELVIYLLSELNEIDFIKVIDPLFDYNSGNKLRSSIITFTGDFHSHDFALLLDESFNIQVRSGLICAHPSIRELNYEEVIQVSTHVYNTKDDIDRFIEGLLLVKNILG